MSDKQHDPNPDAVEIVVLDASENPFILYTDLAGFMKVHSTYCTKHAFVALETALESVVKGKWNASCVLHGCEYHKCDGTL